MVSRAEFIARLIEASSSELGLRPLTAMLKRCRTDIFAFRDAGARWAQLLEPINEALRQCGRDQIDVATLRGIARRLGPAAAVKTGAPDADQALPRSPPVPFASRSTPEQPESSPIQTLGAGKDDLKGEKLRAPSDTMATSRQNLEITRALKGLKR